MNLYGFVGGLSFGVVFNSMVGGFILAVVLGLGFEWGRNRRKALDAFRE